ncbi:PIN/TRAM domain-containing protein [Clostridium oryzae]|uniref:Putative PIN and TRAM-domain containing protein n=1 Tax=Clostridium oryzae TaxID=1450648 RepID=A0A1V4IKP2_9CLOT|nr:PIN/TRAM domain-containing protein [Clostridium oryzae]OPJ60608.1 putative PIN and TRAM-domain containing protein precursor [Clostridium oryzae]
MLRRVLRGIYTVIGLIIGFILGTILLKTDYLKNLKYFKDNSVDSVLLLLFLALFVAAIMFLITPIINNVMKKMLDHIEKSIQKLPANVILFGTIGAVVGLIIASLITNVLNRIPYIGILISLIVNLLMGIIGADIAIKKRDDIIPIFFNIKKIGTGKEKKAKAAIKSPPKVLDTSVIIDGRIFDICQTGFIEGPLVIPNFVLIELRHIADSADGLKRNRGRRGLDVLNKIQKELDLDVIISEKDFPNIAEVDNKLLKLAQSMDGKVITNDYNLNKVAEFQGVSVLNINELANAIKPIVLPGEEMTIQIVKDGKESGQGIAYLDDGTMIVVEGGRKFMGATIDVIVTSVLQTAAGRMIFAKQKDALERAN